MPLGAGCKAPSIAHVICMAQTDCIDNFTHWAHGLTEMYLCDRGNAGLVSTKADMYSFGVVLWELVTADYPRFGQQWYRPPRSATFSNGCHSSMTLAGNVFPATHDGWHSWCYGQLGRPSQSGLDSPAFMSFERQYYKGCALPKTSMTRH